MNTSIADKHTLISAAEWFAEGAAGLDIRMLPGGHFTTAEHPDLLAALIHERALAWHKP